MQAVMLRINRLVVFSTNRGEVILDHDYDCLYRTDILTAFLQCRMKLDDMDFYFSIKKDWHVCHHRVNDVCFAAFINTVDLPPTDALYTVTFLKRFSELCVEFLGSVDSLTLERNLLLVMEVVGCTLVNGYVQLMDPTKVKAYVTLQPQTCLQQQQQLTLDSAPKAFPQLLTEKAEAISTYPKASSKSASTAAITSTKISSGSSESLSYQQNVTQKPLEVFVDVIEKISAFLNAEGALTFASVTGEVKVRSVASIPSSRLLIVFDHLPSAFESVQFGSTVENADTTSFLRSGSCSARLKGSVDSMCVMAYRMSRLDCTPLVISAGVTRQTQSLCVTLTLDCRLPADIPCINTRTCCKLPSHCIVLRHDADVLIADGLLTWTVSELKRGSPRKTIFEVGFDRSELQPHFGSQIFVEPVKMTFEMSNYLISGMTLRAVKVESMPGGSIKKWIRTITASDIYEQKFE